MLDDTSDEVKRVMESHLGRENEQIRTIALAVLVKAASETELRDVLARYLEQGHYYYNIVSWLDKVLYAPCALKEMYKRKLEEKIPVP